MSSNYCFRKIGLSQLFLLLVPLVFNVLFHSSTDISTQFHCLLLQSSISSTIQSSIRKWIIDSTLCAWLDFYSFSMQVRAGLRCTVATIDSYNSCFYGTTSIVMSQILPLSFNIFLHFLTSIELHQEMITSSQLLQQ